MGSLAYCGACARCPARALRQRGRQSSAHPILTKSLYFRHTHARPACWNDVAPSTFCGSFGAPPPPPPCDAESDDDADEGSLGEDDGYRDRRESDDVLDGFMRNWRSDNWNLAVHAGVQVTQSASATTVNAPAADSPAGRLEALLSSTEFKPLAYAIFWRAERPSGASGAGGEAGEVPVLRPCHIASRHVAGVDVNLYLNSCRSSWGFSLGLGMIGRVAWTKKPEWWPDVLRSPSCVFQRQSLCATTGVRWVAAVPTAGGVVEVGGPGVYAEDRDVLSIIVQICGSL